MAVEQNWGLHEIRPGRMSLEQVFMELTADPAAEIPNTAQAANYVNATTQ